MLEFLRSVSAPAVDAVLLAAADARQAVDVAMPDIAHRACCCRARWRGEPLPRRDPDAHLLDDFRVPEPDF
eukprot:gene987-biopygen4346